MKLQNCCFCLALGLFFRVQEGRPTDDRDAGGGGEEAACQGTDNRMSKWNENDVSIESDNNPGVAVLNAILANMWPTMGNSLLANMRAS